MTNSSRTNTLSPTKTGHSFTQLTTRRPLLYFGILVSFLTCLILACVAQSVFAETAPPSEQRKGPPAPSTGHGGAMETYALLSLFGDVYAKTKSDYVEPTKDHDLIMKALNGMLSSLDPHSAFLTEKEFQELSDTTKGGFGGLGMEVSSEFGAVKVISPIDDTPAHRAGLKPGDYIIEIDGQSILGLSLNKTVDLMRGEPGTKVEIRVVREGQEPITLSLTREFINVDPVKSSTLIGDVAYVRISTFVDTSTTAKVVHVLERLTKQAKAKNIKIKGVILDLRNNPGGLLDQAIDTAGLFLGDKRIVSIRGRVRNHAEHFVSSKKKVIDDALPLVVLINNGTASAPEIVAGALKDYNRAVIMGVRSFGKGSVQTIFPFPKRGAMMLTTDYYYTPKGDLIQAKGVEPHIIVEPAKIEPVESSKFREEQLPNALLTQYKEEIKKSQETAPHEPAPCEDLKSQSSQKTRQKEENKPSAPLSAQKSDQSPNKDTSPKGSPPPSGLLEDPLSKDYQVQRALDLVHGLWITRRVPHEITQGINQKSAKPKLPIERKTSQN